MNRYRQSSLSVYLDENMYVKFTPFIMCSGCTLLCECGMVCGWVCMRVCVCVNSLKVQCILQKRWLCLLATIPDQIEDQSHRGRKLQMHVQVHQNQFPCITCTHAYTHTWTHNSTHRNMCTLATCHIQKFHAQQAIITPYEIILFTTDMQIMDRMRRQSIICWSLLCPLPSSPSHLEKTTFRNTRISGNN